MINVLFWLAGLFVTSLEHWHELDLEILALRHPVDEVLARKREIRVLPGRACKFTSLRSKLPVQISILRV